MKTVRIRNLSLDLYFLLMFYMKIKYSSLSTELELDKIKVAKTNLFEFKRTISRLKEMRSRIY